MRCAIYARVSTELDSQKTSIHNQIDLFTNYIAEKGWEITKIYTDKQSGTKSNRPGLKALIEDGKNGKFDVILAKELSRLARSGQLSYKVRDICLDHSIDIVCLDGSINTLEKDDRNFGLYAWLYENESISTSKRSKTAKKTKARRGLFVGSNPPYGYYSDKGVLKVRADETPNVVKRIYNDYIEGQGMDSIAKQLSLEKVPTPSLIANKSNATVYWHASSIKLILSNQHYCGDLVQNRTETVSVTKTKRKPVSKEDMIILEGTHEAIISREVFQIVQTMLKNRMRTKTAPKKHLFTNVLYCSNCGKGMWYKQNQRGYRCGGNIKHGNIFCPNRTIVREKELKYAILNDLNELTNGFSTEDLLKQVEQKLNSKQRKLQNELVQVESKINNWNDRNQKYFDSYCDGIITHEQHEQYSKNNLEKIAQSEAVKAQINIQLEECKNQTFTMDLKSKLKEFASIQDLTTKLLHSLVKKVTCTIDGNVNIHYTFVNPFQ